MSGFGLFLLTGHTPRCPSHQLPSSCTCESHLCNYVGFLALVAGTLGAAVGFLSGSSFATSDAFHALMDAAGDFSGGYIAFLAARFPHLDHEIRERGSKVIALLLAVAVIPIIYELWESDREIIPLGMVAAGTVTYVIDMFRVNIATRAQEVFPTRTKANIISHARSDQVHSAYVAIVGIVFSLFAIMEIKALWHPLLTPENIDRALAVGVIGYIWWQAWKIWKGHDHHHH